MHKCRLTKYVESLHPEKLHPVYTRKRIYTLQDIKDRTIIQEVAWKYARNQRKDTKIYKGCKIRVAPTLPVRVRAPADTPKKRLAARQVFFHICRHPWIGKSAGSENRRAIFFREAKPLHLTKPCAIYA